MIEFTDWVLASSLVADGPVTERRREEMQANAARARNAATLSKRDITFSALHPLSVYRSSSLAAQQAQ